MIKFIFFSFGLTMFSIGSFQFDNYPLLLAPMEDVSTAPFRVICKRLGADIVLSEFVSSEALIRNAIKSKQKLYIHQDEHPMAIQIFGGDEEAMEMAAEIVSYTDADWIDINFGCPVKKIVCKGAGAAILKDIKKMVRITDKVVKKVSKPVTVKTRLGWDDTIINIMEVSERLQDVGIKALTIHGRTRSQMYKGKANWDWIRKVKENHRIHIPIIGNGDVDTPEQAKYCFEKYYVDGVMIGRATIGNPWIFKEIKHFLVTGEHLPKPSLAERIQICLEHLKHSLKLQPELSAIFAMRKFYANYLKGFEQSKQVRMQLMEQKTFSEIERILLEYIQKAESSSTNIPIS